MEDLAALLGSKEKHNDLFDRMIKLLDRQTDHKMSPNVLFGFMGMFNLMSIMSLARETGFNQISSQVESGESKEAEQSVVNSLTSMLSSSGSGSGSGQPDLMGLLGNVASKKKINPGLLLSLFSMLNSQTQSNQQNTASKSETMAAVTEQSSSAGDEEVDKKSPDAKREVELKYDRKR